MKFKAIIFDMDGTIINTNPIWDQAVKKLIESKGIAFTPELEETLRPRIHGASLQKSCLIIKDIAQLAEPVEQLVKEKTQIALSLYRNGITFIPGFVEFHKDITRQNLKSGIATNADDETFKAAREALSLHTFFGKHLYGISCVQNIPKPNPAIYYHVAEKLGFQPHECLAIEDSPHGIMAAKQAGMTCIGINTANIRSQLHQADFIVEGYEEITHSILKGV